MNLDNLNNQNVKRLSAIENIIGYDIKVQTCQPKINKQASNHDLLVGLPKIKFEKGKICDACQMCKKPKTSLKSKNHHSIFRPLELLHTDLLPPLELVV